MPCDCHGHHNYSLALPENKTADTRKGSLSPRPFCVMSGGGVWGQDDDPNAGQSDMFKKAVTFKAGMRVLFGKVVLLYLYNRS